LTGLAGRRDNPPVGPRRDGSGGRGSQEAGALNSRLRRKLEDLGRALSEAISDSSEVSRRLSELREEGYAVYLLLEGEGGDGSRGGETVTRTVAGRLPAGRGPRAVPAPAPASGTPAFRINGQDLALLRSLGIDPTRKPPRRRRPPGGE
jgi:hypothetical protein